LEGPPAATAALPDLAWVAVPGPLVGPDGAVHVVVADPVVGTLSHLTARDGAWTTELIAAVAAADAAAALDGTGRLHVAWKGGRGEAPLSYATDASGAWTVEHPSDAVPGLAFNALALALDAGGGPIIATTDNVNGRLFRPGPGGWSAEAAPFQAAAYDSQHGFGLAVLAGGDLLVVGKWNPAAGVMHNAAWARTAAGWGDVEVISADRGVDQSSPIAVSPDGTRAAFSLGGSTARVHLRTAQGWTTAPLLLTEWEVWAGFGADGRLWALDGLSSSSSFADRPAAYLLYEEPAP
jgi:hypothetical protein